MQRTAQTIRDDSVGWIAACLLWAPAGLAALWGLYRLAGGNGPADGMDLIFMVLWVGTLNAIIPGLIVAWIGFRRMGVTGWSRVAGLLIVAGVTVVTVFWAWGQLSPRASGTVMLAVSALALTSTSIVVRPQRRARSLT